MRFVIIAAVVLSSISLAGCFETTSLGSAGGARDSLSSKRPPLVQDCVRMPFPQCSGG